MVKRKCELANLNSSASTSVTFKGVFGLRTVAPYTVDLDQLDISKYISEL